MTRILVVTHTPTHPANSGNRTRVNSLLTTIQEAGHEIGIFFLDLGNGDNEAMRNTWDWFWTVPYIRPKPNIKRRAYNYLSRKLNTDWYIPYSLDDWYNDSLNQKLKALNKEFSFDVVMVEYVYFSKALVNFPKALKILDTHDIFGDRHKVFLKHGKQPTWYYTTPKEEKRGVNRADVILAIQEQESTYFSSLAPGKHVLTVGHITKIVPPDPEKSFSNRLLFIGSKNDVNLHALSYFLDEIWPEILTKIPTAQLDVIGSICSNFEVFPKGCNAIGPVDDLGNYYANSDVVINPVQFGTGLKIKNIEALGYGMPLVTTEIGSEGIEEGSGNAFRVAKGRKEFIEETCHLLEDNMARKSLSSEALKFIDNYNSQTVKTLLVYIDKHCGRVKHASM